MRNKNIFLMSVVLTVLSLCTAAPQAFNSQLPVFEKIKLSGLPFPDRGRGQAYQVVRIISGNTIVIDMNNQDMKLTLIGVELADKYNKEMTSFVKNLLRGENVYIVADPDANKPGEYDYYVFRAPDGLFVNAEIIRQGYGLTNTAFPFKYMTQFKQLQEFAKERGKGLWDVNQPENISQAPSAVPAQVPKPMVSSNTFAQSGDVIVYVTKTGKKYHLGNCSFLSKIAISMKLSDAKAKGYTPCSKCNPPQ
jgi:endonuclease YncB( thermonuclease family)